MPYKTVAQQREHEEIIKGSRFLGLVAQVDAVDEAMALLKRVRAAHPSANHHCWAYVIGSAYRFSDDGEPGGTAGRPMLEVLQRRELDHVMAVVTRYFGGTKLGAGGLVRAYSGTLAKTLDAAGVAEVRERARLSFALPFSDMDAAHRFLDAWPELSKLQTSYDAAGMVQTVELYETELEPLKEALVELSRGNVKFL